MSFFFFDYYKEGPGVPKDAPPKKGLHLFFDIFSRKFTILIKLNLLFVVSCIPVVTIGPAIGAMAYVTNKMVREQYCDLFYDFREGFRKNWKSSSIVVVLIVLIMGVLGIGIRYCIASDGIVFNLAISVIAVISVLTGISCIYIYPMIVSVELPLKDIIKNSFLLSIIRIKYSLVTFLLCAALIEISIMLPFVTLPISLIFTFSFISFLSNFCAWSGMKKHVLKDV